MSDIREEMKEIAGKRRRFAILLERKGMAMYRKLLYRFHWGEGLRAKRRRGASARGSRTPIPVPLHLNQRWSLDLPH